MSEIKWVDEAEFFANGFQYKIVDGKIFYIFGSGGRLESRYSHQHFMKASDYIERPKQEDSTGDWPKVGDTVTWGAKTDNCKIIAIHNEVAWVESISGGRMAEVTIDILEKPKTQVENLLGELVSVMGGSNTALTYADHAARYLINNYNLTKKPRGG